MSETEDYIGTPGPTGPTGPTGPEGPAGPPGTTTWAGITDKPTEFAPEAHKTSHQDAGTDEISVAGLSGQLADNQPSTWTLVSGKPTTFAPAAHADSHEAGGTDELLAASYVNNFTRPGRLYASDGVTLKNLKHTSQTSQVSPEDNDRIQLFYICNGTETQLAISNYTGTNRGIFDLYVNGVLDSSGYDDYLSSSIAIHRNITLSQPIVAGLNIIELRVNGKNPSSTSYYILTYGANLQ